MIATHSRASTPAAGNGEMAARRMLRAGVGRAVITAPLGIRMAGYTIQSILAESVDRELTATALMLTDGDTTVVLIACDLLFIQNPYVDRIRQRIGQALNLPASNVLINTSHTHLGPMLPGWEADSSDQRKMQQRYLAVLEDLLIGVARRAASQLRPARIGASKGSAPIGINRRERMDDGTIMIGENPEGPIDREVGVIRVDDLTGKPIATVMIAAAHPIVLGPNTPHLSPDFVGLAREIVEQATGAPSLFLQGAAGNVCPSSGIGGGGADQYDDLQRIGAMLGGEVLKTWSQIRTHNRRGPRRVVRSVAPIWIWEYEPLPEECVDHFQVANQSIVLPMAAFPDRQVALDHLATYRRQLEHVNGNGNAGARRVAQRLVHWAEGVVNAIDRGEPHTKELHCWAMRINDIAIVAVNGEPFAELSLEVKRRSPLPHTFFLGYSNGCLGYLPTPEAFDEGGMEVQESHQNYLLPSPFTRSWGPTVVETSIALLNRLAAPVRAS